MAALESWLRAAEQIPWGPGTLALLLGTGMFLTVRLVFRTVLGKAGETQVSACVTLFAFSAIIDRLGLPGRNSIQLSDRRTWNFRLLNHLRSVGSLGSVSKAGDGIPAVDICNA